MFSVCVLCYGPYPELARRCLSSIERSQDGSWSFVSDIRIGLNEVVRQTWDYVRAWLHQLPVPGYIVSEVSGRNVFKYPMMRRLFHDLPDHRALAVMWFDDDSFIQETSPSWWQKVARAAQESPHVGSVYLLRHGFRGRQVEGIQKQKWFTGRPVADAGYRPMFCTGGWWTLHWDIIRRWDWPPKACRHNGGDSLLGELCRQQGYRIRHFREGVAINFDESRGGESRAVRRGVTTPWPWEISLEDPEDDHRFEIQVERNEAAQGLLQETAS